MKLILSSFGFTTPEIVQAVSRIVGKPQNEINIAIINEAIYNISNQKSKRWFINELSNIEKNFGGNIDFVNFKIHSKEEIRNRLLDADLTYIVGGKKHLYTKLFHETDTIDILQEIAEKRVVIGTSAGSMVLGKQILSEKFWNQRYNKKLEDIEYYELGIVPFNIVPHYLREDHKQWTNEILTDLLSDNPFKVYGITDEQAISYIDGKIEFIGGTPEIFGN